MTDSDCIFCGIAAGSVRAERVHEDERSVAFRDINPAAPVHVLVIPREHIASLDAAADEHADLMGHLLLVARDVARAEGVAESGYRTVLNTGEEGGQSVHHVHVHVLGGRALSWPAG